MTKHLTAAYRSLGLALALPLALPLGCTPATALDDPGRVTLHRLNRVEYNNTVAALLGVSVRPADQFPYDDIGNGFDNQADVLSLSPLQVELYQRAAETLVTEALRQKAASYVNAFTADAIPLGAAMSRRGSYMVLAANVEAKVTQSFAYSGSYHISVLAYGDQAGPDPAKMSLNLDGQPLQTFSVPQVAAAPGTFDVTVNISAGSHTVGVAFLNDFYDVANKLDRNLAFGTLSVEGPIDLPISNPARKQLLSCDPLAIGEQACATQILTTLGRRAFRRPLTDDEVQGYLQMIATAKAAGDDFEQSLSLALTAILVSPHFLFRVELDPDPSSPTPHRLSDYELASRLSFFIWSAGPDDALLGAAEQGILQSEVGLKSQLARLLGDPRSAALADNFAGQWLYQRALNDVRPALANFPSWTDSLRQSLAEETRRYVGEFFYGDQPLNSLLTAKFTYANATLATHYGLPGSFTTEFQRVALDGSDRGGLLTQGSLLTVTSYPTRTSPVKRGKWVLEQLLCSGPPPPPPGVEGLPDQAMPTGTLRQRLEEHRKNPICSSCHTLMDPIGFGLENFNGIGQYRTVDGPGPVDASGMLPDGTQIVGAGQLSAALSRDPRLLRCIAQKTATYALGRGPLVSDAARQVQIEQLISADGARFRDLVEAIVLGEPFRSRRGEPVGGGQ
jgi:hypothetical protein